MLTIRIVTSFNFWIMAGLCKHGVNMVVIFVSRIVTAIIWRGHKHLCICSDCHSLTVVQLLVIVGGDFKLVFRWATCTYLKLACSTQGGYAFHIQGNCYLYIHVKTSRMSLCHFNVGLFLLFSYRNSLTLFCLIWNFRREPQILQYYVVFGKQNGSWTQSHQRKVF